MSHQTLLDARNPIFKNGKVFVTFGYMDPYYGGPHYGADCIPGTGYVESDVTAIADGTVEYVKTTVKNTVNSSDSPDALGNNVKITHNSRFLTRYCHMKYGSIKVTAGQKLKRGDIIGTIGNTGYSFGVHTHFEVWKDGIRTDPEPYITGESSLSPDNGAAKAAIATAPLNLRAGADTGSKIIAVIPPGEQVTFLDGYTWYHISSNMGAGYIAANYVTALANNKVQTIDTVNLRENAGTDGAKKAVIPPGTILDRIDSHSWRRVKYKELSGWADAEYLM